MGRPRKPNSLKILEGAQTCRINRNEPAGRKGAGPCPDFLDERERKVWAALAPQLEKMGVMTEPDGHMLALLCSIISQWLAAKEAISRDGMTITDTVETSFETKNGTRTTTRTTTKVNPMVRVLNEAQRQVARLAGRFGLSPADRAGMHLELPGEPDELVAFFASRLTPEQSRAKYGPKPSKPRQAAKRSSPEGA